MLTELSLRNFALIQACTLSFRQGFNVITGETGAGKSMLLGGLNLLAGARGGRHYLGAGGAEALLRARFGDGLELERQLDARRSRCRVNGEPVKIATLQELAARRISIHGQHHNQRLLKTEEQRARLDRFAGLDLAPVAAAYQRWQERRRELEQRRQRRAELQRSRELLEFQAEELATLAPAAGEFEALSQQQRALLNVGSRQQKGDQLQTLSQQLLTAGLQALKLLQTLRGDDDGWAETEELFDQALIYLREGSDSLHRQLPRLAFSPATLAEIENRLGLWHQLARKHRCLPDELPRRWQTLRDELALLAEEDEGPALAALAAAEADYQREARRLHEQRRRAGDELAAAVRSWLPGLGLAAARFEIALTPSPASASGSDGVQLLVAPNRGQSLQPLQRIVSGGELARLSLALEVATLAKNPAGTIIFDEVDSGIGGEVAHSIGRLLRSLGTRQQVICITHLAQVACQADHHLFLEKRDDGPATRVQAAALDAAGRVREIARMLGDSSSPASLELATRLLAGAEALPPME